MSAVVVILLVLFVLHISKQKKGKASDISQFSSFNDEYNMMYQGHFIKEGNEEILCYTSQTKTRYIAELKLKTVVYLHKSYKKDYGYLFFHKTRIKVILTPQDRIII